MNQKKNKFVENYHNNGFYIVKKKIPLKQQNELENLFFSIYSKKLKSNINRSNYSKKILEAEKNKNYDELYLAFQSYTKHKKYLKFSDFFLKFLKNKFRKKVKLINSGMAIGLNNSNRTSYKWHQEKPYYKSKKTIHIQFPLLSNCNKKNGTMSILKGSNKEGFLKNTINIKKGKKFVNSQVPKNIKHLIKKYKEVSIDMQRLDFTIFDENVLHKTNQNYSKKIRLASIYRFQFI